jgi:hypothetical protein
MVAVREQPQQREREREITCRKTMKAQPPEKKNIRDEQL